jgi:hypothetical protein
LRARRRLSLGIDEIEVAVAIALILRLRKRRIGSKRRAVATRLPVRHGDITQSRGIRSIFSIHVSHITYTIYRWKCPRDFVQ